MGTKINDFRIQKTRAGLFALIVFLSLSTAANDPEVVIVGLVIGENNVGIAFANVLLLDAEDSSFVAGAVSNESGYFSIETTTQPVNSLLKVTSIGYEDKYINLDPNKINYQIQLNTSVEMFDEVVITGKKELFEMQNDRLVINVGSVPSFSGNDGLQLLQKVPGIQVNPLENSISMVGKGELMVMIDNKIQRIPKQVLMAQLRGLQAENIDQVELIHQPGAKYDVSGAAGILHIVMKKNTSLGTNGALSVMAGYGQREKAGINISLNHRNKRINLYGDYNYNLNRNNELILNHYREYSYLSNDYFYENHYTYRNQKTVNNSGNLGLDIDLSPSLRIGTFVSLSGNITTADPDSESLSYINTGFDEAYEFSIYRNNRNKTLVSNINIKYQPDEQHTALFELYNTRISFDNAGKVDSRIVDTPLSITTDRSTDIEISSGKMDYTNQATEAIKIEAGVKGTFSDVNTLSFVEDLYDSTYVGSSFFSGEDKMQEHILAAYGTYYQEISSSLSIELGLRYEYYRYFLDAANDENDTENTYSNPFPIVRINKKIDSVNTIQLSYNRTISRAGFTRLGQYFDFLDPNTIGFSNPNLQPAFSNNLRFSFQHKSVILTLGYLNQRNNFYWYNRIDKENALQIVDPQNLDKSHVYEVSLNLSINPTRWWETTWAIQSLYQTVYDASSREIPFNNERLSMSIQFNNTFSLSGGWLFNIDGRYQSPFLVGDQVHQRKPFVNAGIRKSFKRGASLSISFIDIGNSSSIHIWSYDHPALEMKTYGHNDWSERQVRVTYTMNFGNRGLKNQRRGIQDEELKSRM